MIGRTRLARRSVLREGGSATKHEISTDMKLIIEHWPTLPVELRQAIIKMVRWSRKK